ncbi:MAG: hypothetical protein IT371_25425 [Deltaproteobacteria bacterium]|nr:hypothetical protein [Deltaproteobacteria bacterium]
MRRSWQRQRGGLGLLAVAVGLGTGCASSLPTRRLELEPIKLQATGRGEKTRVEVLDAQSLFELGNDRLSGKQYAPAVEAYDRLVEHFASSKYVPASLYNAGLAWEGRGRFDRAAASYRQLVQRFGATKDALDAAFRLGGAYAELHNWRGSADTYAWVLARTDVTPSDRVEALSRKALAHFRLREDLPCRAAAEAAMRLYRQSETGDPLATDFFAAMAQYYLGALHHRSFREAKVSTGGGMGPDLDRKARLLISAQAGYIAAVKVKNLYWATAAGFQIGSLYREFYNAMMISVPDFDPQAQKNARKAKIPVADARAQLAQVYLEEVHKKISPLLEKAVRVFEKNVLVAERIGIRSAWIDKSRRQLEQLKHLLSASPSDAVKQLPKPGVVPEDEPGQPAAPPEDPGTDPIAPAPEKPGRAYL